MILEKAYYQQNFEVGPFLYQHYGLGAFIEEGETHKEVYAALKERVHAQFMADNPHLQSAPQQEPEVLPVQQVEKYETGNPIITEINACQTWDELKSYRFIADSNVEWSKTFQNRKKELGVIG